MQFLDLHLANSGALVLAPEVLCWDERTSLGETFGNPVLQKVASRIQSFILFDLHSSLPLAPGLLGGMPFLRIMAIITGDCINTESLPDLVITGAPTLSHFMLRFSRDWSRLKLELPWPSITSLDLSEVPPRSCIEALYNYPNLIHYRACTSSYQAFPSPEFLLGKPFTLPYLESFERPNYGGPSVDDVLQRLRMPALQTLFFALHSAVRTCALGAVLPKFASDGHNTRALLVCFVDIGRGSPVSGFLLSAYTSSEEACAAFVQHHFPRLCLGGFGLARLLSWGSYTEVSA